MPVWLEAKTLMRTAFMLLGSVSMYCRDIGYAGRRCRYPSSVVRERGDFLTSRTSEVQPWRDTEKRRLGPL